MENKGLSRVYKHICEYLDILLNFIYPRNIYCILCNEPITKDQEYSLCAYCREKIHFIDRCCEKCGKPLELLYLPNKCPDCMKINHYFTEGFSCVEYNEEMKKIIHRLKYQNQRYLSYHMAQIMKDQLQKQNIKDIDYIFPVPLYKDKERKRGFNQSYLLSKYLGKWMNIKVNQKCLLKIKDTLSQNQLSKEDRKNNLKDAFFVCQEKLVRNKTILLIDDVYTTGNTVDACCKEILKFNPKEIYVLTFATGKNV
ncbi:ComF family protein [Inediibacterium massiliense]|uniref:ComF family protein n=1 Tax=Inediibacterium massiliense TaxID=1658111 RepID=UPI0006B57916|nr:ComF family protein [Inediibacterium massiliense]